MVWPWKILGLSLSCPSVSADADADLDLLTFISPSPSPSAEPVESVPSFVCANVPLSAVLGEAFTCSSSCASSSSNGASRTRLPKAAELPYLCDVCGVLLRCVGEWAYVRAESNTQ